MNLYSKIVNFFDDKNPDLEFIDSIGYSYTRIPIKLAKHTQTHFRKEQEKSFDGKYKFPECPGMWDYSTMGYILPAWTRMHIKANKAGCVASIGGGGQSRGTPFKQPGAMSTEIVKGMFEPQDGIPVIPWRFDCPWKVYSKKNISAFLLPAIYHSRFLDDIFVYPGIVNYNKGLSGFNTMNFIAAAKRKCEVTIEAGEPLLHIIPFLATPITAEYGPGTKEKSDGWRYIAESHIPDFYRKLFMGRRKYKLEKNSENYKIPETPKED